MCQISSGHGEITGPLAFVRRDNDAIFNLITKRNEDQVSEARGPVFLILTVMMFVWTLALEGLISASPEAKAQWAVPVVGIFAGSVFFAYYKIMQKMKAFATIEPATVSFRSHAQLFPEEKCAENQLVSTR